MRDLLLVVPPGRYGYLTAEVIFYCCSPSVASLFRDKSDLCLVMPAGRYGHLTAVVIFPFLVSSVALSFFCRRNPSPQVSQVVVFSPMDDSRHPSPFFTKAKTVKDYMELAAASQPKHPDRKRNSRVFLFFPLDAWPVQEYPINKHMNKCSYV